MCGEVETQEHGILPCPKEIVEWQARILGKKKGTIQNQKGTVHQGTWLAQKGEASFM